MQDTQNLQINLHLSNPTNSLYFFGSNAHSFVSPLSPIHSPSPGVDVANKTISLPALIHKARSIEILWSSWCDALISINDADPSSPTNPQRIIQYRGTGLTEAQAAKAKELAAQSDTCVFFGSPLQDGLRGILSKPEVGDDASPSTITLFSTLSEISSGTPELLTFSEDKYRIQHLSITSSGRVPITANMVDFDAQGEFSRISGSALFTIPSLSDFKTWLSNNQSPNPSGRDLTFRSEGCVQILSNATTSTALTAKGRVCTWTEDPRYSKCLGRRVDEFDAADRSSPVSYLSHTKIKKIATGGYMAAALSGDGELFVWGQACPGTEGELAIFKDKGSSEDGEDLFIPDTGMDLYLPPPPAKYTPWSYDNAQKWAREVAVMRRDGILPRHPDDPRPEKSGSNERREVEVEVDDDQDELVKCVSLEIEGKPTRMTNMAVGHGHILVAAETEDGELRTVFSAGQGECGQLGVGGTPKFVEKFTEVVSLRGRKVKSLNAAGWSSWVVTEDE